MVTNHDCQYSPQLSVPLGAVVGEWWLTDHAEDVCRCLTWSRDAAGAVAVEWAQYGDGHVERFIALQLDGADAELDATAARQLAAALLDAADSLNTCEGRL